LKDGFRENIEISFFETIIVTIQSYLGANLYESSNLADMTFSIPFFPVAEIDKKSSHKILVQYCSLCYVFHHV